MTQKKIYLAGPMRGIPEYNFPAFDKAARDLRKQGWHVINPAELDRVEGITEFTNPLPPNFLRGAMRRDLSAICDCDAIGLPPRQEKSAGVRVELALADLLKLKRVVVDASVYVWTQGDIYYRKTVDGVESREGASSEWTEHLGLEHTDIDVFVRDGILKPVN